MTQSAASAGDVARRFVEVLDARDWTGLADLLAPGFSGSYVHTGETFTRDGFVALNRDYPAVVRLALTDLVATADRAVVRARVSPAEGEGEVFHVASFLSVTDGLVHDLVEVWSEAVGAPPPHRS